MSFTKTYFLCPTSDFIHPPPGGPLFLGSIIRSTSAPQYHLNGANAVPVTNENPPVVETDWKKTVSAETGSAMGVYAQFLQLVTGGLPLGPEVEIKHSNRTANTFAFDTVTTVSFVPTPQYIEAAVQAPAVQTWLREPKQRFAPGVSLFLVTGMKLVNGAKIKYSTSKNKTFTGNLGLDVAPLGITVGPKGHWKSTDDHETQFNRDSEFVFAFRLKRIKFGRKMKVEEHNKGAFLAIGTGQKDDESVLVEDVDGSDIKNAIVVTDTAENESVYCIPP